MGREESRERIKRRRRKKMYYQREGKVKRKIKWINKKKKNIAIFSQFFLFISTIVYSTKSKSPK